MSACVPEGRNVVAQDVSPGWASFPIRVPEGRHLRSVVALLIGLIALTAHAAEDNYLDRTIANLEACRADLAIYTTLADDAAKRLVAGGTLYGAGQASMISELSGRAGGMMMMRNLGNNTPTPADVVLWFAPLGTVRPDNWPADAFVIHFADGETGATTRTLANHASNTGLVESFANVMPGWLFTTELVGALTRLGEMPVMYETIGLYGGFSRIDKYKGGDPPFHTDMTVPPAPAGALGTQLIDKMVAMVKRVKAEESEDIAKAAGWFRDAKAAGHTAYVYSMGHLYPHEVDNTALGEYFSGEVYYPRFRNMAVPVVAFQQGDVVLHIGYQHSPDELLEQAVPSGAKVVYVDLHRNRDFVDPSDVIWIDPMWDWSDAIVTLEGYDIPFIPPSGIVNTAIAWEIYRQATE